jgi:hypothetical protein
MGKLSSENLYHYTKRFKLLLSIVENGFEYRRCEEDLPLTGFSGSPFSFPGVVKHLIFPEVVCFCDIPFELVSDHVVQYGEYCIGLTKEWGMKNGITPIRYVHYYTPDLQDDKFYNLRSCSAKLPQHNHSMLSLINEVLVTNGEYEGISQNDFDELPDKWKKIITQMDCEFLDLIEFTQNYIGNMRSYEGEWEDRVTKKKSKRRFYDEREWRALKTHPDQTHLDFEWNDITEIVIKEEGDRAELINLLNRKFQVSKEEAEKKLLHIEKILKL